MRGISYANAVAATAPPKNRLPVSPINILAGFMLYGINPKDAPVRIAKIRAISVCPVKRHMTNTDIEAIDETPTASPSRPSMRFTAFVTPTIHRIVTGIDKNPKFIYRSSLKMFTFAKVTINIEKQNRHQLTAKEYKKGRSYLTVTNQQAQMLVNKYSGTGYIERDSKGKYANKEFIISDEEIGVNINSKTNEETLTKKFYIHYSKTGTHIVPTNKGG